MNRALWLLIALKGRGRLRKLARNCTKPAGLLSLVVGGPIVLVFYAWFVLFLWGIGSILKPAYIHDGGPLLLAALVALQVLRRALSPGLRFDATEIDRIFAAPVSRRALLAYRFVEGAAMSAPIWILLCVAMRPAMGHPVGGVAAVLLFLLFRWACGRLAGTVALEMHRHHGAKGLLGWAAALALLIGAVAFRFAATWDDVGFEAAVDDPAVAVALLPFRAFTDCFLADGVAGAIGLTAAAFAGAFVYVPDFRAGAIRSAAGRRRLQEKRRAGESGGRSWTLLSPPMPPYWGGAGPMVWRQLVALCGSPAFLFFPILVVAFVLAPDFAFDDREMRRIVTIVALAIFSFVSVLMLPGAVRFDFRSDIRRIALLRRLPIGSGRLALAQLAVPVAVVSVMGWVLCALWWIKLPEGSEAFAWAAALFPPYAALMIAFENLMVLLAPAAFAGGRQAIGVRLLMRTGQLVVLGVVGALCAAVGAAVYEITAGDWELTLAATVPILAAAAAAMVPAVAWAYRRFDVAEDLA